MYQFIHVESYSLSTPKKASSINKKTKKTSPKSAGHSVSYIVKEALREPGSIPHIENPLPPTYLYGKPLEQLEETCKAWAMSLKDARGHAMRKDALCLLSGVISAPNDIAPDAWDAFEKDAVEHLKKKYGDSLETVIAHYDESHPHIHFYVVPRPGMRFESVHQGRAAAAEAKALGKKKGEQNQAYKQAMREFQDEFYDAVGIEHGFTRIGPGRRRLTREEAVLEKIQAAAAAEAIAKARQIQAEAEETRTLSTIEAEALISEARSGAQKISLEALKKADEMAQEAAKKGFESGLNQVEKMPWWKKISTVISRAVRERDDLKGQVQSLEADKETWMQKAKKMLGVNTVMASKLKEIEPELSSAKFELSVTREKAREADKLKREAERLQRELSREKSKNQHLEATVDALNRMIGPEKAPSTAKQRERGAGAGFDL